MSNSLNLCPSKLAGEFTKREALLIIQTLQYSSILKSETVNLLKKQVSEIFRNLLKSETVYLVIDLLAGKAYAGKIWIDPPTY